MRKLKKSVLFLLLAIISLSCFACDFNGVDYDSSAKSCAQQLVQKSLNNPYSAVFNEVRIELKDEYHRYVVYVDVSAQNGFGGYNRETYYVGLRLSDDAETYFYRRYLPYVTTFGSPESARDVLFDDWGQPPQTE